MDVILGQIFGIYLFLVGLGMIVNTGLFIESFHDIKQHPGVRLMSALFPIFMGAVIVALHPVWIVDWTLSITLLGYGLLVVGTLRYLCMQCWFKLVGPMVGKSYFRMIGVLLLVYGGFMMFHAFPQIVALLLSITA
jgi:hypothetical protein